MRFTHSQMRFCVCSGFPFNIWSVQFAFLSFRQLHNAFSGIFCSNRVMQVLHVFLFVYEIIVKCNVCAVSVMNQNFSQGWSIEWSSPELYYSSSSQEKSCWQVRCDASGMAVFRLLAKSWKTLRASFKLLKSVKAHFASVRACRSCCFGVKGYLGIIDSACFTSTQFTIICPGYDNNFFPHLPCRASRWIFYLPEWQN